MLKCGLLGEKLGHSYSPQIHAFMQTDEKTGGIMPPVTTCSRIIKITHTITQYIVKIN